MAATAVPFFGLACEGTDVPEDVTMQPRTADVKWSTGSVRIMSQAVSASDIPTRLGLAADAQFERGSLSAATHVTVVAVADGKLGWMASWRVMDHDVLMRAMLDGSTESVASANCSLQEPHPP
ncbi:hypothetical protein [Streptomyces sp. NPDC008125]|uniref:hypothetical protein n=1 Tax=Streptomyces sp. NPDC008125 TaxID=3364811 RepID=UPI0036EB3619